jgi:hypothetical protein
MMTVLVLVLLGFSRLIQVGLDGDVGLFGVVDVAVFFVIAWAIDRTDLALDGLRIKVDAMEEAISELQQEISAQRHQHAENDQA